MKIKASADYGIRAVMYLAVKEGVCSSREISEEMNIPRDYLIQLALNLRKAGIISTRPGKNGGYELAKPTNAISVGEIMAVFDPKGKKKSKAKARRKKNSPITMVEKSEEIVSNAMNAFLNAITVADLLSAVDGKTTPEKAIASALAKETKRLRSV